MNIPLKYQRFLRYSLVGGTTLLFDLALLFLFTDVFHIPASWSAAIAFLIAVSLNYKISRHWVFPGTKRQEAFVASGFFLIALSGLILVSGGMYLLTEIFAVHYLIARIAISWVTGFWNYLLNLYSNFQVAGKDFHV